MNFYKNLTDGKKSALTGGIIILVLFTIIYFYGQKRKEKLNKNPYITIGIVEKLMPNASKSTITEKDVIYFYFVRNDTVYHKITDLSVGNIKNKKIELKNAYELKVAEFDDGIFSIEFNKKLNKYVDKTKYHNHIYNSEKHRNLVE